MADGWDELLVALGRLRFAGIEGVWFEADGGKIVCNNAPQRGIDENLFGILKLAVVELHLTLWVNSIDTGGHAKNSRHYTGRACDIDHIQPYGEQPRPATLANSSAVEFVQWCLDRGFKVGESRPQPAVIFGPPGHKWNRTKVSHRNHVHISLPQRRSKK